MRIRLLVGGLGVAALTFGGVLATAMPASSSTPKVTGVSINGNLAHPTVVVHGTGFGKEPTGTSAGSFDNCRPDDTGDDFGPGNLVLIDSTAQWVSGTSNSHGGACVGLNVTLWTAHKVSFTFGSAYGPGSWELSSGDVGTVLVKGDAFFFTVS